MRINKVSAILGKRGSGKTYYTRKLIAEYSKAHPSKRVLIMDTLDHPAYRDIPAITPEQITRWKAPALYRVFSSDTDEILRLIAEYLTNSFIIFEDASKYIRKNLQPEVRRFILDSKQKNADLIFIFHGFSFVPPELFRVLDKIVLFKTDSPEYRRAEIIAFDQVYETWKKVMKDPDPYAKEIIEIY